MHSNKGIVWERDLMCFWGALGCFLMLMPLEKHCLPGRQLLKLLSAQACLSTCPLVTYHFSRSYFKVPVWWSQYLVLLIGFLLEGGLFFPCFLYISGYLVEYWIWCVQEQKRLSYILPVPRKLGRHLIRPLVWGLSQSSWASAGVWPLGAVSMGPSPSSSDLCFYPGEEDASCNTECTGFAPTPTPEEGHFPVGPGVRGLAAQQHNMFALCEERFGGGDRASHLSHSRPWPLPTSLACPERLSVPPALPPALLVSCLVGVWVGGEL